jgi:predicted glycosyltransferase
MMRPRVFFYVQHLLGIGHLARASRIASALAENDFDVTVVTGGTPVAGFPGRDVEHVILPPVIASDEGFSGLTDSDGNPVDDLFKERRRQRLLEIFHARKPDILMLEAFPFGRRQMRFELLPLLEAASASSPRPLLVTSIRDILQERIKPGRVEETVSVINRYFDLVLVHGDPGFVRLEETFPLATSVAEKVAYTGLVAGPSSTPGKERYDVVVSAGGGAAGKKLVASTLAAARLSSGRLSWCLITGPNLPRAAVDAALADPPPGLSVFRFREDFAGLLTAAGVSVSQAGYNTVCDILRAGCRTVLVPFAAGGETEQPVRASRLERLGLAMVLMEEDMTPITLAAAIETALSAPQPQRPALQLDGARRSAQILRERLEIKPRRSA